MWVRNTNSVGWHMSDSLLIARYSRSSARSTILNSKFSWYSAATGGKIGSAVKIISGWLNNSCSVAAAPRASAMTVLPARTVCDGSDSSQLQKVVGNHDLRCRKFLCPVRFHIIVVPLRSCIKAQP